MTTKKNSKDIDESPATKHKTSSGKTGKRNMADKNNLSLFLILFNHRLIVSSPTIQATTRCPAYLPIKKAQTDPIKMPIKLYKLPKNGPNSSAPATTVTVLGMGRMTTCANCNKIKTHDIQLPERSMCSSSFLRRE